MATSPNVCEPSGSECDVALLRDIVREYARTWQDCLCTTNSPEDTNALSPKVKFHVRGIKCLYGGSDWFSIHRLPTHLIKDIDKGYSVVTLQRHRGVHALLRCQHLGEGVWEFPGSYVNGCELGEEGILEC